MAGRSEPRVADALTDGEQLTTHRLLLRPWCADDVHELPAALADPLIARWTRIRAGYTRRDATAWVGTHHGSDVAELAIVRRADDRLLGGLRIARENTRLRAGYWVRASARGEGVAGEALQAAARRAAHSLPSPSLEVLIRASNERSQRAAHRVGFESVGRLPAHRRVGNHLEDYVLLRFGRTRT
jgi:RimJ/RimL family protein N-acetyltransferase